MRSITIGVEMRTKTMPAIDMTIDNPNTTSKLVDPEMGAPVDTSRAACIRAEIGFSPITNARILPFSGWYMAGVRKMP